MSLRSFRRIFFAAAAAGLIAGLLLTGAQAMFVVPLIRAAEAFETLHDAAPPTLVTTAIANVVLATAFGLFLGAAMSLRPSTDWRAGLAWGAAGYLVFFVAPSLGLPPELPGTDSAPLQERQVWWLATVACTAAGLAMLVFARRHALRAIGVILLVAPHLIGAPQPPAHGAMAPADLAAGFERATYLANAAFWLVLGALVARFAGDAATSRTSAAVP